MTVNAFLSRYTGPITAPKLKKQFKQEIHCKVTTGNIPARLAKAINETLPGSQVAASDIIELVKP